MEVPAEVFESSITRVKSAIASAQRAVPASVIPRFRMASANAGSISIACV
jgi:hypothetical protein